MSQRFSSDDPRMEIGDSPLHQGSLPRSHPRCRKGTDHLADSEEIPVRGIRACLEDDPDNSPNVPNPRK